MNRVKLIAVVMLHFFLCLTNTASIPVLMFLPFYLYGIQPTIGSIIMGVAIACPLITFLGRLTWRWESCPLTLVENQIRHNMGLPIIHGWLGHYFVRPIRRLFRRR